MEKVYLATRRFLRDEEGVTAIEYGLIATLVALLLVAGAGALGTNLNAAFQHIADCISTGTVAACT